MATVLKRIALLLLTVLALIQLIPVSTTNPPITRDAHWNSPATRALTKRACFDCHSNETRWPWYVRIAPVSFLMANHVNDGRRDLNFSEWDKPQRSRMEDVQREVNNGDMPIWNYVLLHPDAKLSEAEKARLLDGLKATFLLEPPAFAPRR